MRPEHEQAAFLRAICEHPDDDAPRLIYADWLDEHIDRLPHEARNERGESARAEFIRLQCRLAESGDISYRRKLENRAGELLHQHWQEWGQPLADLGGYHPVYRRGFVDEMRMTSADFLREGAARELFARIPVRTLNLSLFCDEDITAVAATEQLLHLTALNLAANNIGDGGAQALAASPYLRNLAALYLGVNDIGDVGAQALASSPHLRNLTTLHVGGNNIGDGGAEALAASQYLPNLTTLHLDGNNISPRLHAAIERRLASRRTEGQARAR